MLNCKSLAIVGLILLSIAAVIGTYYLKVGSDQNISTITADWGTFGDYFGGVAGTLLSFVSILLLVYTIHQQNEREDKKDMLAHVAAADAALDHWLQRRLAVSSSVNSDTTELGDIVWGLVKAGHVSQKEFSKACDRLLELTCLYCEALSLYRTNVNAHHVFRHHWTKADSLLKFLENNRQHLYSMAGPTLLTCRQAINGDVPKST